MKGAVKAARQIVEYLAASRGVGHTRAVMEGADNVESHVMFSNSRIARIITDRGVPTRAKWITLDAADVLRGSRLPLVLDNSALAVLLEGLLAEIDEAHEMLMTERSAG